MLKGDPEAGGIIKNTARQLMASILPGHKE